MRFSFDSFLASTLEYKELPKKLEQEQIKELFDALLKGQNTTEQLIKGHMRLGMAIVAERATERWSDDLVGTVFLELTKRIDYLRQAKNKKPIDHVSLTPYLAHAMRRRRNDFLSTFPYIVSMNDRTLRRKTERVKLLTVERLTGDYSCKRITIEPEFMEILTLAICTEEERRVITFRAQGYKQVEIAPIMNSSLSRVSRLNNAVEHRFDQLMCM